MILHRIVHPYRPSKIGWFRSRWVKRHFLSLSLFYHPLFYHPYNQCGWMEDERRFIHWNVIYIYIYIVRSYHWYTVGSLLFRIPVPRTNLDNESSSLSMWHRQRDVTQSFIHPSHRINSSFPAVQHTTSHRLTTFICIAVRGTRISYVYRYIYSIYIYIYI